ncbi:unnamed protein product [Nezara viridula]|uniref:Potassium channel domain-containing protein n=1 Tax=Nezara viridula TaxID=85310 RepID=A0A9P0E8Y3_NEZVI|nr:unnamed protein product [Nezara viridula]
MDEQTSSHRCTRILYFTWKIFTCLFTHVMLVTLVVAYCMLGAVTFEHLERDNEIFVKENITYMRRNITEDLWLYTKDMPVLRQENWTIHALKKLKVFENDLVLAMRKSGWDGSEDINSLQWTFAGALFYSIIVITTIGYGHIAPKTQLGKVSTIFYAIVGIPLMLLCLSNIGDIMAHSFRFLYWRVCCYSCTREEQSRQNSRRRQRMHSGYDRNVTRDVLQSSYNMRSMGPSQVGDKQLYKQEAEDWEIIGEEEIKNQKRIRRGGSGSYGRYSRSKLPPYEVREGIQEVQHSVLYNKYAIDNDDYNKAATLPIHKEAEHDEHGVAGKLRGAGNFGRRSTEHLNTSPRIMSPMGFIVPRQNQAKVRDYYDYSEETSSTPIKPVPIWLCVFLVVSYIVGGAFLFSDWEDWGYADSAYFCFITLTTIGFGDFVPAQRVTNKNGEMSIALCSLYLLFGIALLAMSFNLVQEEVIANVKAVAKHLGIIKDDGEYID